MRSVHMLSFVLLAATATAQTPSLAPRIEAAGDALIGRATGDQSAPAIARGGSTTLVVWADRRASLSSSGPESGLDIFGLRLDATGAPLDTVPFPIATLPGDDSAPRVAWNGSNWLVAWKSQAPGGSIYSAAMVGARVSPAGQVLDAAPIVVLPYSFSDIGTNALASDGNNWVVVAQGTSGGSANLRAARVSAAGVLLDPTPVSLMPEGQLFTVQLAHAGTSFLLVWSRYASATDDDVVGRRFGSNLAWQDAAPFTIGATSGPDLGARVGSNGSQFLVAWDRPLSIWREVGAARVSSAGQLLDVNPIAVCSLFAYGSGPDCAPAFDGTNWFVSWDNAGPKLGRISAAGVALDGDGFASDPTPAATFAQPALAPHASGGVQVVWSDDRAGSYEGLDVFGARVQGPAAIGAERALSLGAPAQAKADLAHGNGQSLMVFQSEISGQRRILATRLDALGLPLDPEPIELSSGPLDGDPSVAWDGAEYLVTWNSGSTPTVFARRLSAAGVLLDPTPISLGSGATPELAALGGDFLVVFARATATFPVQAFPTYVRVRGSDGLVLGPTLSIPFAASSWAVEPDVAVVGGRWLVAWQRNYSVSDTHCDVQAAFVDSNGAATTAFWVAGGFNTYNSSAKLASSGNEALIAWTSGTASNLTRRVQFRRVDANGTFLDAAPVSVAASATGERFLPAPCWNGNEYVLAFQDQRAVTSSIDQRSDIYAVRVSAAGVVLDGPGLAIEAGSVSDVGPATVGLGSGRALLASARFTASPFTAYRLGTRAFDVACPTPISYCTAKLTSALTLPTIGFSGSTSVAGGGFSLTLSGGLPSGNALCFYGSNASSLPWLGGWKCVSAPALRTPLRQLDAAGATSFSFPLVPALAGETRCFQWWLRDGAHPDGTGVVLSNALSVTFCP
ncbi:MAG: hypothetical protein NTV21_08420 [Planctomycetota bacterium]|nr:hypothetical protein [Planctomycetota bacterium]